MKKQVIILGAGGGAGDVLDCLEALNQAGDSWEFLGFLDDAPEKQGTEIRGFPVLGDLKQASKFADKAKLINEIAGTRFVGRVPQILEPCGLTTECFINLVHPSATVSPSATLGAGIFIGSGVHVGSEASIGSFVKILPNSVVSHHVHLGDYSFVAGGVVVNGYARIGAEAYLGSGSQIMCFKNVGKRSIVGMGSVVLSDVSEKSVVAGCPAVPLRPPTRIK